MKPHIYQYNNQWKVSDGRNISLTTPLSPWHLFMAACEWCAERNQINAYDLSMKHHEMNALRKRYK